MAATKAEAASRVFIQGRDITKFPLVMEEAVGKLVLDKPAKLVYCPTLVNDIDGLLYESDNYTYIAINQDFPVVRQRFSIAHEIGHIYLGHEVAQLHHWDMHEDYQEIEANEFAAGLLMPASRIYTLARQHRDITKLLFEVTEYFDVSLEAAARRITSLDLFRGAIIKTGTGKRDFRFKTSDFYDDTKFRSDFRNLHNGGAIFVLVAETYVQVG